VGKLTVLKNNAFQAGSHFLCQAPQWLALHADSSLMTLLIDFAPAMFENLVAGYTKAE